MASLSPLDRIVYPAEADGSPPPADGAIYEIVAVHEVGRREAIRIVTARRAERD